MVVVVVAVGVEECDGDDDGGGTRGDERCVAMGVANDTLFDALGD